MDRITLSCIQIFNFMGRSLAECFKKERPSVANIGIYMRCTSVHTITSTIEHETYANIYVVDANDDEGE